MSDPMAYVVFDDKHVSVELCVAREGYAEDTLKLAAERDTDGWYVRYMTVDQAKEQGLGEPDRRVQR